MAHTKTSTRDDTYMIHISTTIQENSINLGKEENSPGNIACMDKWQS